MSQHALIDPVPNSFGVFKPVGWLMVGMPPPAEMGALRAALQGAGWSDETVLRFTPRESLAELQALVDNAGPMAGFGYEITLLRRYVALTAAGYRWLLVRVNDANHAAVAADIARKWGATLAVHYRMLTVEELIAPLDEAVEPGQAPAG